MLLMLCWLRRIVCKAQNLRVASSVLLCLSLNFIRVIYKKIIVTSLVLVYFFPCVHLCLCHPFLITTVLCLEEMLHVLGVLLLFIGSICRKTTKYFIRPLNVSFGLFVKRKADRSLETCQRVLRLCSHFFHH